MKKKTHEIVLSVITILTVIVTAVGVSFAYFSANMTGRNANIVSSSAKIGTVTFKGGADFRTASNIEPGWSESKTFTISMTKSNVSQRVYVKMDYTNTMPDLKCSVTPTSGGAKGEIALNTTGAKTTVILVDKTFPASTSDTGDITYTLTMELPETGLNQNASQGKKFEATLYAELANEYYYNSENPNGTTIKPTR